MNRQVTFTFLLSVTMDDSLQIYNDVEFDEFWADDFTKPGYVPSKFPLPNCFTRFVQPPKTQPSPPISSPSVQTALTSHATSELYPASLANPSPRAVLSENETSRSPSPESHSIKPREEPLIPSSLHKEVTSYFWKPLIPHSTYRIEEFISDNGIFYVKILEKAY